MASVEPVCRARNVSGMCRGSPGPAGYPVASAARPLACTELTTEERKCGVGTMDGRTALVTGGSRGIGLGIAQSLVDRGARVVLTARKADALAEAVESLGGPDVAVAVPGHAGDAEHRATAVATAVETFGSLDMLVGNVGVNPVYGPLTDLDLDAFRKILDTNVVSSLGLVQEAYRAWMADHGGAILFVASVAGLRSSENIGAYGVSKAAVINLTTQLAVELGPRIRVNAVAPAVVKTRFAGALYEGREAEVAAEYPVGRLGTPEDVGEAAAYLLGQEAGWVTGQTLVLDGGRLSRGR
ncbi:MAG: uncharacterized protein JWR82_2596 [Blastococcus sp.]|jgi:NAD(P)-dependent dehydrogenase (short-subunit alcohol dehydrogenase family)|nr:uncharacterized protein [Blastococcus sp.]